MDSERQISGGSVAEPRTQQVTLSVSDHSQLRPLQELLRQVPELSVLRTPGRPERGELGALDVLTVVAGSSSLVAAVKVLPEFIRSRRTSLSVTITTKGESRTLEANNVAEVMPIIERLIND
jgi:membrane-associated two-gene conflict system component 1 (EACC1)